MARVLVAKQAWGVQFRAIGDRAHVWDTLACSINTTVYAAATGSTEVPAFTTNDKGELPGWVEEGTYNLTVNGVTTEVSTTTEARTAVLESTGIGTQATQGGTVGAPAEKLLWRFQPVDTAKAPFTWHIHGASFNGTWDSVMYLGYNATGAGGQVVATEPSFRFVIEQDYEVSEGTHWLEAYMEWIAGSGATAAANGRPVFWRFDRGTGTIVGFDIKSKGVDFTHWDNDSNVFARIYPGGLTVGNALQASSATLAMVAPAGGYGSVLTMQHNGSTALSLVTNSASNVALSINGNATLRLYDKRIAIGGIDVNSAAVIAQESSGGDVFIARDGPAGQTGQFFAARDAAGTVTYWRVSSLGHMHVAKTSAPPDAYINAGEAALWFDSTNGAAKLMIKAKQADGTVRTGSVALA